MTKAERNAIKRMDTELFNMANMADSNEDFLNFISCSTKQNTELILSSKSLISCAIG